MKFPGRKPYRRSSFGVSQITNVVSRRCIDRFTTRHRQAQAVRVRHSKAPQRRRDRWRRCAAESADFGGQLADHVAHVGGHLGVLARVLAVQRLERHRQLDRPRPPAGRQCRTTCGCRRAPTPRRTGRTTRRSTASGLPLSAPSPNGRDSQSIAFLSTAGYAAVVLRGDHQGGVGVGGRGPQRDHGAGHVGVIVDVLVVERQITETFEDRDGDARPGATSAASSAI